MLAHESSKLLVAQEPVKLLRRLNVRLTFAAMLALAHAGGPSHIAGVPRGAAGMHSLRHFVTSLPLRRSAAVVAMLLPATVPAQRRYAEIAGFVTDTSGAAVPGAEVAILGSVQHRAYTDSIGHFRFAAIGPGERVLTVRRIGFIARSFIVQLASAETAQLVLELEPFPVELPDIVVSVPRLPSRFDDFRRRQATGFGTYITRAHIAARAPRRTSELMTMQLGIELGYELGGVTLYSSRGPVVSLQGSMGGEAQLGPGAFEDSMNIRDGAQRIGTRSMVSVLSRCRIPIVLDDALMSEGFSLDDILPGEIEAIEVYRGMATIPAQYLRYETRCGLVIVWTREGELRRRSPSRRR